MEHFDTPNELKQRLSAVTAARFSKTPEACTDAELCQALLALTQQLAAARPAPGRNPKRAQTLLFFGRVPHGQAAQQQSAGAGPV